VGVPPAAALVSLARPTRLRRRGCTGCSVSLRQVLALGSLQLSRLCRVPLTVALTHHFAGYLTVYLTVLLVSPFPGPSVAVTRFSDPMKGTDLAMHTAIPGDENGAG
jgi:heme A synthase